MHRTPTAVFALLLLCGTAHSQDLHAVRPVPGHVCMMLALPPEVVTDPNQGVPIRNAPSPSAPIASWAPSVLVVPAPQQSTAGFVQILLPDRQQGWVLAAYLKPWSNPYVPGRRCTPSVMSNGRVGYDFH